MGLLVNGHWQDKWYDTQESKGRFIREEAQFSIKTASESLQAESGRYHLYISHACPWAHRTLILRLLKGLEKHISVTATSPDMLSEGWQYDEPEPNYGFSHHHQLYTRTRADYTGRVTVPVLWDKKRHTIVSNESSEIIRLFNRSFNSLTENAIDFYPEKFRKQIDELNDQIYSAVNNGVYRCGFATSQSAYNEAISELFATLDQLEQHLSQSPYLTGEYLTEADIRLFTTLIRFDAVYVGHFKCNIRRIADYPHLQDYLKAIYQYSGIHSTVNFDQIKRHYYYSHNMINPGRIIPEGPDVSALDTSYTRPSPLLWYN